MARVPVVVDMVAPTSAEDLRTRVVFWRGGAELHNMSREDAERVWVAYMKGAQPLHEVLKTEGLW